MKIGVWIPNCRDLATPEMIRASARHAEELGYDSVFVSDHVVVPNAYVERFGAAIYDPLITLSVLAGVTTRVLLGTTVLIVPYRNPVLTAKMIASLDALSGGRVVLGIGVGWVPEESAMLGVEFAERGTMTDEYLVAMRELWTSPAPAFTGKHTRFGDLHCDPKPAQKPHPPIWVGGHSPAALRRAVAFGAAWHPINRSAEDIRAGRAEILKLCATSGRACPPGVTMRIDTCMVHDGRAAPAPLHGPSMLSGEPQQLVDQIHELAAAGVEHLVLEFLAMDAAEFQAQMTLFADRVRPKLH